LIVVVVVVVGIIPCNIRHFDFQQLSRGSGNIPKNFGTFCKWRFLVLNFLFFSSF